MKLKICKIIRILTVAPVMALATLLSLYFNTPDIFGKAYMLLLSIFFLCVLPILAYPLQKYIPHFKDKGREGQRNLAMVFAMIGYILGVTTNLFLDATQTLWLIYVEYLLSGLLIVVFNKIFKLRASAHACGVAGPTVMLAYLGVYYTAIPGILLYVAAFISSIIMKWHTWQQFVGGTFIPIVSLAFLVLVFRML